MQESKYLTRQEAGDYLKQRYGSGSKKSLAKLATEGGGPAYRRFGNRTLYTREDLDRWFEERSTYRTSTSTLVDPQAAA